MNKTDFDKLMQSEAEARLAQIPPEERAEIDKCFEEFWKPIIYKDGQLNLEQLKLELWDFQRAMSIVSKVYGVITGFKVSKILTDPDVIITMHEDQCGQSAEYAIEDYKEELAPEVEALKALVAEKDEALRSAIIWMSKVLVKSARNEDLIKTLKTAQKKEADFSYLE